MSKLSDAIVARKYLNKIERCIESKTEFTLSFAEYKRVVTAKYCRYTGILLTTHKEGKQESSDITIDRIDNSKGYIKGNVAACCYEYNQLKAIMENPQKLMTFELVEKALKVQKKLQAKQ